MKYHITLGYEVLRPLPIKIVYGSIRTNKIKIKYHGGYEINLTVRDYEV